MLHTKGDALLATVELNRKACLPFGRPKARSADEDGALLFRVEGGPVEPL